VGATFPLLDSSPGPRPVRPAKGNHRTGKTMGKSPPPLLSLLLWLLLLLLPLSGCGGNESSNRLEDAEKWVTESPQRCRISRCGKNRHQTTSRSRRKSIFQFLEYFFLLLFIYFLFLVEEDVNISFFFSLLKRN